MKQQFSTDEAHRQFLLNIATEAAREVGAISPELKLEWESRRRQIEANFIKDESMQRWLINHADYWQPKDRAYADYVRRLAQSYQPAITLP